MKTRLFFIFISGSMLFSSCHDTVDRTTKYTIKKPIYEYSTEKEAEEGLFQGAPSALSTFGNIYVYQNYLLINERGKGIHIYDNSNPSSPNQVSFMNIPGNFDMAIQNNILYVDSYDDLLSLNISDPNNIQLIKRVDNVFPDNHPSRGVIVGYKDSVVEMTEKIRPSLFGNEDEDFLIQDVQLNAAHSNTTGTGGSFARFTIANNHLFAIDSRVLNVFDISNSNEPVRESANPIWEVNEIETLFPYKNSLFIGSTDGLIIYDISDPKNISFESIFTHARACDPVYVEDDVAFVTLRSNNLNRCSGANNQLDIIDVEDIQSPRLLHTYSMINPHGVGVDDSLLFVCEAQSGLKIYKMEKQFNNSTLTNVSLTSLQWNRSIFAYDVIPYHGILITVGDNALFQYDYSDLNNIKLLSKIE